MNVINRLQQICPDRYDYSSLVFVNLHTPIQIKCVIHNILVKVNPRVHLQYNTHSCPICYKEERKNNILKQFDTVHGDTYNYDSINYVNNGIKIDIICKVHGVFQQRPDSHLRGHGCPKCSFLTTDTLIELFKKIHKDTYDYSLVNYTNHRDKVKIICRLHGIFEQRYDVHLKSVCPMCSRRTNEELISQFRKVHGNKYNYSLVDYTGSNVKVKIICSKHGIFKQTPNNHLSNRHNCPKCALVDIDNMIEAARQYHNDFYDYSKIKYIDSQTKVDIICPKHGLFKQTLYSHSKGSLCPECTLYLTSKQIYENKRTVLYYISINDKQFKVGITKKKINTRFMYELKDNIKIDVVREIVFDNGYEALLIEQQILKEASMGKLNKQDSIIKGGFTEVRNIDFINIFDEVVNNYTDLNKLKILNQLKG